MIDILLAAIPNQTVSIRLDDRMYSITVKETRGVMSVDILRDNEPILSGSRCVPMVPLITYRYLEAGNFVFLTENDEYPYYTEFGNTQSLVYVSPVELEALRNE